MSAASDSLPGLRIETSGADGTLVMEGELDLSTVSSLRSAFTSRRPAAGDLILDVSQLRFIDSTGLQEILDLSAMLSGGVVLLRDPPAFLLKLLRVTGLDHSDRIRVVDAGTGQ